MAEHPELGDRARGWLRHLWRKATTPDDWTEDGEPHAVGVTVVDASPTRRARLRPSRSK